MGCADAVGSCFFVYGLESLVGKGVASVMFRETAISRLRWTSGGIARGLRLGSALNLSKGLGLNLNLEALHVAPVKNAMLVHVVFQGKVVTLFEPDGGGESVDEGLELGTMGGFEPMSVLDVVAEGFDGGEGGLHDVVVVDVLVVGLLLHVVVADVKVVEMIPGGLLQLGDAAISQDVVEDVLNCAVLTMEEEIGLEMMRELLVKVRCGAAAVARLFPRGHDDEESIVDVCLEALVGYATTLVERVETRSMGKQALKASTGGFQRAAEAS